MKALTILATLVVALLFVSCSNLEQNSPVSPDFKKDGTGVVDAGSPFDYLQCFKPAGVKYFGAPITDPPGKDGITVIWEWPKKEVTAFAIIEYNSPTRSTKSEMVFLGKLKEEQFLIPERDYRNLADVRIYALSNHLGAVNGSYPYLESFESMIVNTYKVSGEEIAINSNDWKSTLNDTFAELITKEGDFLTYIGQPDGEDIMIPKFGELGLKGVKLYGLFDVENNLREVN